MSPDDSVRAELAPSGALRAAINFGNPILAQRDASGATGGVAVEIARELARRLGVEVLLIPFDAAGDAFTAVTDGTCEVTFLAVDPKRAAELTFTEPYVVIEGGYLVRNDSPLHTLADVDAEGVRVAVGRNAAYDLYLSRTLTRATIVRAPTSAGAIELFDSGDADVGAGIRGVLVAEAERRSGMRVLPGRFMEIRQAAATRAGRQNAARYLRALVEELKASGFIAQALARSGQTDVAVAARASG